MEAEVGDSRPLACCHEGPLFTGKPLALRGLPTYRCSLPCYSNGIVVLRAAQAVQEHPLPVSPQSYVRGSFVFYRFWRALRVSFKWFKSKCFKNALRNILLLALFRVWLKDGPTLLADEASCLLFSLRPRVSYCLCDGDVLNW
jgi:hypothetical protein